MADDVTADPDPFATLGNETRLRIVETLADRTESLAPDAGLAYSTLREAVGIDDNGRFNYHLGLLRDRFVRKTETGYRLTFAGVEVAKTLQVGVWTDPPVREAVEVDPTSSLVGGDPLYASYRDGLVRVHEEGGDPIFHIAVRPVGAERRTMPELVDAMATLLEAAVAQAHTGVCPYCQSEPERALVDAAEEGTHESPPDGAGPSWRHCFVATCPECGPLFRVPAGAAVVRHPAVVSWYWDRGIDLRSVRLWDLALFGDGAVVTADPRGPVALRLRAVWDDATLELDLADDATVVAVRRR
jgi:DNA-binding transcriptional ArsR family regulator